MTSNDDQWPAEAPDDLAAVEARLAQMAAEAPRVLRDARQQIEPGDAEQVRAALRRAVGSGVAAPRRAWRPWFALAAALLVAALGWALFDAGGSRETSSRRWLSGPDWIELVDAPGGAVALRLTRELAPGTRYDLRVWAGDPAQQICAESTQAPQWNLPPAALSALEEHGSLEILVERIDDSGATPPSPARLVLRSR